MAKISEMATRLSMANNHMAFVVAALEAPNPHEANLRGHLLEATYSLNQIKEGIDEQLTKITEIMEMLKL